MQIRSRMCAREFKSDDRPDLYAGTTTGSLESNNINCSEQQGHVLNHAHCCVTCVLPRKGPETCVDTVASGGLNGR